MAVATAAPTSSCPGGTDEVRQGGGEDGGDGTDDHGDGGVGDGVVQVAGGTADDGQQGTLEESQQDGVDHCATQGAPDGHGTAVAGLVPVVLPQRPGHGTGTADAKEVAQAGHQVAHRQAEGDCGDGVGVTDQAGKPGVRHVVDDVDDLADDRGQGHGQEDFWNGVGGKDALFSGAWVHPFLQR